MSAFIAVPYYMGWDQKTVPPPPDDEPGWEYKPPVPFRDPITGILQPGFGEYKRKTTRAERMAA